MSHKPMRYEEALTVLPFLKQRKANDTKISYCYHELFQKPIQVELNTTLKILILIHLNVLRRKLSNMR
uniref:Uncharacterized protein n=1 Tax=Daphnia magna TaxID=35525 RepID=A0A0P6K0E1_9CRUS